MTDASHLINHAHKIFNDIVNDVEAHFDSVASSLRDQFSNKPLQLPPRRPPPPPTTYQQIERWISKHKALTAAIVAFAITGSVGSYIYVKSQKLHRKRRARKSPSGARTDIVVVAGAVANPLTSALYLDLERRGFVVYVVANTAEDERYIRSQSRADLIPLTLDLVDPYTAQDQIMRFRTMFTREHVAFEGAEPHKVHFRGLVLVPDTQSSPARVEDIGSEEWSDVLNAKVLNTIVTTQLLLPAVIENKAKILLLTPSVAPALRLPLHSIEGTAYGALQGFSSSLAAELKQDGITLSHLKLGNFDIPVVTTRQRREGIPPPRLRPTPLRQLHDTVFDELVASRPHALLHIGRGSRTYDLIGVLAPPSFIAWMMGVGKRPSLARGTSDESLSRSAGSLTWEKVEENEA
ncbi:hypothetical protein AC578_1756 [Pseudocercospora eumusae]|uniref:DUF1776-domain-containing protein n=1 Tax=Pseudocercospora eumusae TaxID=321146 RepID=A0A139H7I9_9PEZI|nr:hypothetical protein AC578_1756 [Pseudocercospora eumusae]